MNECVGALGYDTASAEVSEKLSEYNDEFFEKHTLLILHLLKDSSVGVSVKDVNIKDGAVDIELKLDTPQTSNNEIKAWDFLIEIDKTDITTITWTK